MGYTTYILYSVKLDKYYTGSCEDITTRINQHNTGRNKSTKSGMPWEIKYIETHTTRSEAQSREMEIKKKKAENILNG